MSEPLEPWIVATQTSLGAVISAPKLTDKLLRKPPFRFLHDVVTNFIKAANFPVGLYSDDMLDSSKCTEKEQKLEFLQQLVNVVQNATGKSTTAKPAKIIAGAEPEGTNDLLQLLAACAALSPKDKERAVKKTLGGSGAAPAAPPPAAPPTQSPPPPAAAPAQPPQPAPVQAAPAPAEQEAPKRKPKAEQPEAAPAKPQEENPAQARLAARAAAAAAAKESSAESLQQPTPLAPAAAGSSDRPGTATARKAPPKVVSNEVVENRTEPVQPVAGVIVESKRNARANEDDDEKDKERDWMKLVEEQESAANRAGGNASGAAGAEEAKGYLAQQALKAKREQEEAARKAAEQARESGADGSAASGIILSVQKRDKAGSAMGDGELTKLREQLQLLTKASNPLGKFLEAIHEDIDTMSRELEMWRGEARTQASAARDAQRETESTLHEVHVQLQALEDSIGDQITKTNMVRAKILENEKTIETMVRMVVNPDSAKPAAAAAKR